MVKEENAMIIRREILQSALDWLKTQEEAQQRGKAQQPRSTLLISNVRSVADLLRGVGSGLFHAGLGAGIFAVSGSVILHVFLSPLTAVSAFYLMKKFPSLRSLFLVPFGGLGVALAGLGRIWLAFEHDHALIYHPVREKLELLLHRFGVPVRRREFSVKDVAAVNVTYQHCQSCGEIFGRRQPLDPLIAVILKSGEEVYCGDYDLAPVEEFLSKIGPAGLYEEFEVKRIHRTSGLCGRCASRSAS